MKVENLVLPREFFDRLDRIEKAIERVALDVGAYTLRDVRAILNPKP